MIALHNQRSINVTSIQICPHTYVKIYFIFQWIVYRKFIMKYSLLHVLLLHIQQWHLRSSSFRQSRHQQKTDSNVNKNYNGKIKFNAKKRIILYLPFLVFFFIIIFFLLSSIIIIKKEMLNGCSLKLHFFLLFFITFFLHS